MADGSMLPAVRRGSDLDAPANPWHGRKWHELSAELYQLGRDDADVDSAYRILERTMKVERERAFLRFRAEGKSIRESEALAVTDPRIVRLGEELDKIELRYRRTRRDLETLRTVVEVMRTQESTERALMGASR